MTSVCIPIEFLPPPPPPSFQGAASFVYPAQHLCLFLPARGEASEDSVHVNALCSYTYSFTQTFIEGSVPGSELGVDRKAQKELSNCGQQTRKL